MRNKQPNLNTAVHYLERAADFFQRPLKEAFFIKGFYKEQGAQLEHCRAKIWALSSL